MTRYLDLWKASHPFRELMNMDRDLRALWNENPVQGVYRTKHEVDFVPSADIEETPTHYVAHFDIPGISKDHVKVEVSDHMLTVSGEKVSERKEEKNNCHVSERTFGKFSRSFTLPSNVNFEQVEATFKDGVLKVSVPKQEELRTRQVKIN